MEEFRRKLEHSAFGVCAWLGDKMGIQRSRVRIYFIYLSCLSLGSSLLFYFFIAFWLNIREYLREGRRQIGL
ncbi:PspC domain-containing protein [Lewinella sp. IMCC34191]|uniref:PspC domain-containing protein n=1 Tax=Lewinella sp. IMCC34191 TaxID=2259172 RepID=UPI000E27BDF3|nr:PspC family transcriptional regulator [Lewinella sp. IMCC34191]